MCKLCRIKSPGLREIFYKLQPKGRPKLYYLFNITISESWIFEDLWIMHDIYQSTYFSPESAGHLPYLTSCWLERVPVQSSLSHSIQQSSAYAQVEFNKYFLYWHIDLNTRHHIIRKVLKRKYKQFGFIIKINWLMINCSALEAIYWLPLSNKVV